MKNILFLFGIVFLLVGCSASERLNRKFVRVNKEQLRRVVEDTTFLNLKGDFYAIPQLLWDNKDIYERALWRLESRVRIEKNRFVWDFKSADEMHISQDLYNYIVSRWKRFNERLDKGKENIMITSLGHWIIR